MFTKVMTAAAVAAATIAMAMPASALAPLRPRRAILESLQTAKRAGTAKLGYDGTKWYGTVHVRAGALAPGTYAYGVEMLEVGVGSGDALCTFTIAKAGDAGGCSGTTPYLTPGVWLAKNYADVFAATGGSPILEGLLVR